MLVPGEKESVTAQRQRAEGVRLLKPIADTLAGLGKKLAVDVPKELITDVKEK